MPNHDPFERSPLSKGVGWAYRVMSLGMEFILPALAGHGVDRWLKTHPWGMLLGALLGFGLGLAHLIRIAREGTEASGQDR